MFPPLSVWKSLRMIGVSSPLFSAESRKDVSFSTICCTRGPTQRVAPPSRLMKASFVSGEALLSFPPGLQTTWKLF